MASDGDRGDQGDGGSPSAAYGLLRFLAGRPLANRESRNREIGAAEGVPALGLDGLSSTAYGPEAALTILTAAGAAGARRSRPGHAGHPDAARDFVHFLLADHCGLSEERRRLHGFAG